MDNIIEPKFDIRHESIINALPVYNSKKEVLVVGCGDCKIDYRLIKMGYNVYSTDYVMNKEFQNRMSGYSHLINFSTCDIFNLSTFPVEKCETVICAEVLEHLIEYKKAFKNLLELTEKRLIVTVPFQHSFNDPAPAPIGHCNYWSDQKSDRYKNINEFYNMVKPYATSIQKIRTKEKDVQLNQYDYLIIVDKNQKFNN
jgi:Methyltransferase domain